MQNINIQLRNGAGIQASKFEFLDGENTPLARLSHLTKDIFASHFDMNVDDYTTFITSFEKSHAFKNKNVDEMNHINPELTYIWFHAKKLDALFSANGLNQHRFAMQYDTSTHNICDNEFRNEWIYKWNKAVISLKHTFIGPFVIREGTESATLEDFEGLIKFDMICNRALRTAIANDVITLDEYHSICESDISIQAVANHLNLLLESNPMDVLVVTEYSPQLDSFIVFDESIWNRFTPSVDFKNDITTVIFTHKTLGEFHEMNEISVRPNHETTIITNGTFAIIGAHLTSSTCIRKLDVDPDTPIALRVERVYETNETQMVQIKNMMDTIGIPSICALGANQDLTKITYGLNISTCNVKYTKYAGRTNLQTQLNKGLIPPKYELKDFILHSNGWNVIDNHLENGGIGEILLPCREWPMDHFGVSAQFNLLNN